jgi:hypothetical protein
MLLGRRRLLFRKHAMAAPLVPNLRGGSFDSRHKRVLRRHKVDSASAAVRATAFWKASKQVERPFLAGQRPLPPTGTGRLNFRLFRHFKNVINLNTEIPHSTFKFRMAEQQLYSPQILGASINQRPFCPSERMSTVTRGIQPELLDPRIDDPRVLPCR